MNDKYILVGHTPVLCNDSLAWAKWFELSDRKVARTEKNNKTVSTVFLGMDHAWGDGPPMIFETMIFDGTNDEWADRCSTWEQAEVMHKVACKIAFGDSHE